MTEHKTWYERGDLPPVGETVIAITEWSDNRFIRSFDRKEVEIILHDHAPDGTKVAVFKMVSPDEECHCYHALVEEWFRPIKSDRERAIEAAKNAVRRDSTPGFDDEIYGRLFDAGLLRAKDDAR